MDTQKNQPKTNKVSDLEKTLEERLEEMARIVALEKACQEAKYCK